MVLFLDTILDIFLVHFHNNCYINVSYILDGVGWDMMCYDGMGYDGMGWDMMGYDGMG